MIAKRSSRTSQPPGPAAGIIQRLSRQVAPDPKQRDRGTPGVITREVAASLLSPSGWVVLTTQLPAMAAALAYRTIFGLVPVLVIGLMVVGAYAEEKEISTAVTRLLHFAGIDQVAVDSAAPPVVVEEGAATIPPVDPPPITENPVGKDASKPVVTSQRLDEWISGLVKQVRSIPFRTIGFIGLAALIYAAISMLVEIERTFNQIFRVPAGRAWWSRITRYWTLLTLGSIGLFATFYATDAFLSRLNKVESWNVSSLVTGESAPAAAPSPASPEPESPTQRLAREQAAKSPSAAIASESVLSVKAIVGYAVTVLISTGFLTIIYSVVPNARVRLTAAISGAFVAAILWEAAKWGFAFYVKSAGYTKLYGALALLPLFLLWIYVAWMIILLGLFISYTLQTRGARPVTVLSDGRTSIVDPASILLVAGAVAREFRAGRSSDSSDIARVAGLEEAVVVSMLEAMVERGILHRIANGDGDDRFALARPPEAIDAAECLAIGTALVESSTDRPAGLGGADSALLAAVRPLQQARSEAARGRTLSDLLGIATAERPVADPVQVPPEPPPALPAAGAT